MNKKYSSLIILGVVANLLCCLSPTQAKPDWQSVLAQGYHELAVGNTDKAIKIFQKKTNKYPNSAACHTALGRAYKKIGKMDEAKDNFLKSTQLEPEFAQGFYELGVVEESDKHWSQAASAFERYKQLEPNMSERQGVADRIKFDRQH